MHVGTKATVMFSCQWQCFPKCVRRPPPKKALNSMVPLWVASQCLQYFEFTWCISITFHSESPFDAKLFDDPREKKAVRKGMRGCLLFLAAIPKVGKE